MITVIEYLKQLADTDPEKLAFVIKRMHAKNTGTTILAASLSGNCCGTAPTGPGPTANGSWQCDGSTCKWVWVPTEGF